MPEALIPVNSCQESLLDNEALLKQQSEALDKTSPLQTPPKRRKRKVLTLNKEPSSIPPPKYSPFKSFLVIPLSVFVSPFCEASSNIKDPEVLDSLSVLMESMVSFDGLFGLAAIGGLIGLWTSRKVKKFHPKEEAQAILLENADTALNNLKIWEALRDKLFIASSPQVEDYRVYRNMRF